jgi:hypothetical protein
MEKEKGNIEKRSWKNWLKKFGIAGFLFFLIKGLVWLALIIFGIDAIF